MYNQWQIQGVMGEIPPPKNTYLYTFKYLIFKFIIWGTIFDTDASPSKPEKIGHCYNVISVEFYKEII